MSANESNPCRIIGVLDNGLAGLTPAATAYIQAADLLIGGARTLALFKSLAGHTEIRDLTGALTQLPFWIDEALSEQKNVVVLASGDPLCHGIGGFIKSKLEANRLEIIPNISSIQIAFARFAISWQDAGIISIHHKDTGEWRAGADRRHGLFSLLQAICRQHKLAVLTSPENTPDRIARLLLMENLHDQFDIYIAEDLLQTKERLLQGLNAEEIAGQTFNGNDVVILVRRKPLELDVLFGLEDACFYQRKPEKGLITKREIRAVSLARLQLKHDSVVWDIGAGSGAVGLEAARLCPEGHVYAIEKNAGDIENAQKNAEQMNIHHYTLVHAKAPEKLNEWMDPDAVFLGGSGGELASLIEYCLQRMNPNGWLVMNFVTVENLTVAVATLKQCQVSWDVTQIQASRSQPILHMHRFQAENPVWVVSAQRDEII